jgi:hypothetical protein
LLCAFDLEVEHQGHRIDDFFIEVTIERNIVGNLPVEKPGTEPDLRTAGKVVIEPTSSRAVAIANGRVV